MRNNTVFVVPVVLVVYCTGLFLPWWPLSLAAVLWLAGGGRCAAALALGLLLDLVWGTPSGMLRGVPLPVTLLTAAMCLGRTVVVRYLRDTRM